MAQSTYPEYQNASGWNALLPPRAPRAALATDTAADVAIIGAGYTGIAAARRWAAARDDDRLVVLESGDVGEGNPGRNSGFLLEIMLANDADMSALPRMRHANQLIGDTMNRLRDDVFDAGIRCDIERCGTYRAAAGAAGKRALDRYRHFLQDAGLPFERLNAEELKSRVGTGHYQAALYSPQCYLVQPAALIRGLADLCPSSVEIFERTPALRIRSTPNGWSIQTPSGSVEASTVIVANNAFAKQLGLGSSRVVAMYTYAGLTQPMPDWCRESAGSDESWGILPTHRLGCTLRRTRDGRLLMRSQYDYEREADNSMVSDKLLDSLKQRYPDIPVDGFDHVWGGATGFTLNGAPIWGQHKPGLFVSAGCNGGGVVKGTLFGEQLADLALGREVQPVAELFGSARWMPPDPIRRLGFEIVSRIERHHGRAEM